MLEIKVKERKVARKVKGTREVLIEDEKVKSRFTDSSISKLEYIGRLVSLIIWHEILRVVSEIVSFRRLGRVIIGVA